jgi:hypothetical protein
VVVGLVYVAVLFQLQVPTLVLVRLVQAVGLLVQDFTVVLLVAVLTTTQTQALVVQLLTMLLVVVAVVHGKVLRYELLVLAALSLELVMELQQLLVLEVHQEVEIMAILTPTHF